MKTLSLFLFCLLSTQAAVTRKSKRGNRYAVREAPGGPGGDGGYQYPAPSSGGGGDAMAALMAAHHDTMSSFGGSGGSTASFGGSGAGASSLSTAGGGGGGDGGYHYEAPAAPASGGNSGGSAAPIGFADIQSFSAGASAALDTAGGSTGHSFGSGASSGSFSLGGSTGGHGGYDFNSILNSGGSANIGGSSGSSDQFTAVQGEVIDEHAPSIFKYKPHFGGKDINNLPHILPPGGKSIQELQDEADAKLRSIVSKAKINQMEVLERISKLRTNYGYGTLGYDGYSDTRFKKTGNIDLGTHQGKDLGTSIDYNALKGSDGKLKLPVQNVYHTKTLGIHIPEPYPVKHEVAVPHPFPVPHPIPVSNHKPTPYSPLSHDDIEHLSADDGRGSSSFGSHLGSFGSAGTSGGGGGGGGGGGFTGASFSSQNFGADFSFGGQGATSPFKGGSSSSFSIEPSQSISESSSVGGLPYGAGTPNAAEGGDSGEQHIDYMSEQGQGGPVSMFGLPPGASSGALSTFNGPSQEYGAPSGSQGQAISSEAGTVHIPSMNFGGSRFQQQSRPQTEYGPPS